MFVGGGGCWPGDGSVSAESNHQFHWMPALYSGWLHSMRDVQTEPGADCSAVTGVAGDTNIVKGLANCSGAVAEIVPGSTPVAIPGDPSWMFGYPLVFSYQHRYFADERLAKELYPGIKAFADYLKRMADAGKTGMLTWVKCEHRSVCGACCASVQHPDSVRINDADGDWLEPGRTPSVPIIGEMGTGFNFGQTLRIVRDTATALGRSQDAAVYGAAHAKIQRLYHEIYWNASIGTYGNGQQTALVYALYLGAVPAANVPKIFAKLLARIQMTDVPPPPREQQDAARKDVAIALAVDSWHGPIKADYGDTDCPNMGCHGGSTAPLSVRQCEALCDQQKGCNAFNHGGYGCCLRACAPGKQIKSNRTGQGCCSYNRGGPAPPPCASFKTQSECHGPFCLWDATKHACQLPPPPPPPTPPPPCAAFNVTTCVMARCVWNTTLHECQTRPPPPFVPPRQQCKSPPCIGKHSTHVKSFRSYCVSASVHSWANDPISPSQILGSLQRSG